MNAKRLPRKRKKRLLKYGGWEYYVQVGIKNSKPVTEKDFEEMMNKLSK